MRWQSFITPDLKAKGKVGVSGIRGSHPLHQQDPRLIPEIPTEANNIERSGHRPRLANRMSTQYSPGWQPQLDNYKASLTSTLHLPTGNNFYAKRIGLWWTVNEILWSIKQGTQELSLDIFWHLVKPSWLDPFLIVIRGQNESIYNHSFLSRTNISLYHHHPHTHTNIKISISYGLGFLVFFNKHSSSSVVQHYAGEYISILDYSLLPFYQVSEIPKEDELKSTGTCALALNIAENHCEQFFYQ